MIRVCLVSGDALHVAVDEDSDVRSLKRSLQSRCGHPRFRQRLLHEGRILDDEVTVVDLTDLQLVFLDYIDVTEEQQEALKDAAWEGRAASVEAFLQLPQNPNRLGYDQHGRNQTALAAASYWNHVEIVRMLLEACADANGFGYGAGLEAPSLVLASVRRHLEVMRLLLDAHAHVEAIGWAGGAYPPLLASIAGSDYYAGPCNLPQHGVQGSLLKTVKLLLEADADPDGSSDYEGAIRGPDDKYFEHDPRPLVAACQGGHLEVVQLLLDDAAAQASRLSPHGHLSAALVAAASGGHLEVARLLLAGAPPTVDGCRGTMPTAHSAVLDKETPLCAACWYAGVEGDLELVRVLLEARADKDKVCSADGATALSAAAGEGYADIVRMLLNGVEA